MRDEILCWNSVANILLHGMKTGPGDHTTSYPVSTVSLFLGVKVTGVLRWPLTSN
jgi:hypothetical protein